jgi:multicomponent Na+:H+ antiporter subunit B
VTILFDVALLTLLATVAVAVARMRDLFGVVMMFGIYSLLSAMLFVVLDAPDVAMTEAAVGAGISTALMIVTLSLVGRSERAHRRKPLLPLVVVLLTAGVLLYGLGDLPVLGDPNSPVHKHVAPYYLEAAMRETGVPNIVTSVLASYRGYDTLGETSVVFAAGIGVLALLSGLRRKSTTPIEGEAGSIDGGAGRRSGGADA